jgi:hypothetical protein
MGSNPVFGIRSVLRSALCKQASINNQLDARYFGCIA